MCNWSEGIAEVAMEKGMKRGIEQGIAKGIERGVKAFIELCREMQMSEDETASRLRSKFNLTEENVQKYMEIYWNEQA